MNLKAVQGKKASDDKAIIIIQREGELAKENLLSVAKNMKLIEKICVLL